MNLLFVLEKPIPAKENVEEQLPDAGSQNLTGVSQRSLSLTCSKYKLKKGKLWSRNTLIWCMGSKRLNHSSISCHIPQRLNHFLFDSSSYGFRYKILYCSVRTEAAIRPLAVALSKYSWNTSTLLQLSGSSIFLITFLSFPLTESMTIQRVKGLLYRLLKIPGSELKLSYKSSKVS